MLVRLPYWWIRAPWDYILQGKSDEKFDGFSGNWKYGWLDTKAFLTISLVGQRGSFYNYVMFSTFVYSRDRPSAPYWFKNAWFKIWKLSFDNFSSPQASLPAAFASVRVYRNASWHVVSVRRVPSWYDRKILIRDTTALDALDFETTFCRLMCWNNIVQND